MVEKIFKSHLSKYLILSWIAANLIAFLVISIVFFKIYNKVVLHAKLELSTIAKQSAFEIQTYVKLLHSAEVSLKNSIEANFYLQKIDYVIENAVVLDSNIYAVAVVGLDKQVIASYPKNLTSALINHAVCSQKKINISSVFYANGHLMVSDCLAFNKGYVIAGRIPVLILLKSLIELQYKSLNIFLLQKDGKFQDTLKEINPNEYKNYIKFATYQNGKFESNGYLVSYTKIPYTGRILFASVLKKEIYENYLKNMLPFFLSGFFSFVIFNIIFLWVFYKLRYFEKLKLISASFVKTSNDINALMIDKMSFRSLLDRIVETMQQNQYIGLCIFYFKGKNDMKIKSFKAKQECLECLSSKILNQCRCMEIFSELTRSASQAFTINTSNFNSLAEIQKLCGLNFVGVFPVKLNDKVVGSLVVAGKDKLILKSSEIFDTLVQISNNLKNKLNLIRLEKLQASSQNKAQYLAYHDQLTGLVNRSFFAERFSQIMSKARRLKSNIAVFSMDLDGFKAVNDTYGHDLGDKLLKNVSLRLKSILRQEDTLCRFGGDEFLILTDSFEQKEELEELASRILNNIKKPFVIENNMINIGISIGIAYTIGKPILTKEDYLKIADDLLYKSKKTGRNKYTITQL